MSSSTTSQWQSEFGIVSEGPKVFFGSEAELNASSADVPQSHVLRRAFDSLKLDGILCTEKTPLVYFKLVNRIEVAETALLHHKFWNHGGAPILVLVAPNEINIYTGFMRPGPQTSPHGDIPALVERLERASNAIREFLPAVESGEYFRRHKKSFNPANRVDRVLLDNLQATREKLSSASSGNLDAKVLDALLCRLVFTCYLFDREIIGKKYLKSIGLQNASHLRDILGFRPRSKAKKYLYALFEELGKDFNGDLFSDDLSAEARMVDSTFIGPLEEFFHATDVATGQTSFPFYRYDFAAIPIEAVSAIYERFRQEPEQSQGAFYTPRFLVELVLDIALAKTPSLLGRNYLDPACGSGIFLVALFNRMAEEWKQANPTAPNDRRARELRQILCNNLHGVDVNPTACGITAFSLYLAYLDQLSPRDIQELKEKGHKLPRLVHYPENPAGPKVEGNIWCGDFFTEGAEYPTEVDLVIGNPPWGSTAVEGTPAAKWCAHPDHLCPVPDKQISAAFIWKAARHASDSGRICLVLPHGTLFNHSPRALEFQRTLFARHAVYHVLNLVDFQFFLFSEARHPALVVTYGKSPPKTRQHPIEYWGPKTDWLVTRAEVITVTPEDRCILTTKEVLDDLETKDAPQIWKRWFWATARDRRLVDRLSLYPRLRDQVRQTKEKKSPKPWLIAEGFQPVGKGDDPAKAITVRMPSRYFIDATSTNLDLFLLPDDCTKYPTTDVIVRSRSNKGTDVFRAPHVLVSYGFTSIVFADFDVSFRHALRGISGPKEDREMLIFLAAFLRSSVARYFLFHTSSNWGISRQKIHIEELLRLPFPLPDALPDPQRAWEIVNEVSGIVATAAASATEPFADRSYLVQTASDAIEKLIDEYLDILPLEKALIDDTEQVTIPSVRPTRAKSLVPTIIPSQKKQRDEYTNRLCETLNGWAKKSPFVVHGLSAASEQFGVGVAILQKTLKREAPFEPTEDFSDLLATLERLRRVSSQRLNTFELIRGVKIFDRNHLYLVKPIGQRFWTQTAALNDADEIAGTILMQNTQGAM